MPEKPVHLVEPPVIEDPAFPMDMPYQDMPLGRDEPLLQEGERSGLKPAAVIAAVALGGAILVRGLIHRGRE